VSHLANTLSEGHFQGYLADPDVTVLVIDDGGALRGYSLLVNRPAHDPDVATALTLAPSVELSKCYVHPDHHGLGAAAELMHASLQAAAAAGGAGVWLGVNSQNARAIRFYEKSGFRKVGSKSFRLGTTVEHDFVLERALP
jgi:ribosomal protein S18 acetylase RimI-like enzyme